MTLLMHASLSISFSYYRTNPSIIPLSLTLINIPLPTCFALILSLIYLSIHHPCWPAQVITHCDDGFVALISLIIVVSYNLVLCRDLVILLWLYLTSAIECAHVCVIPLCPWLTSTLYCTHIVLFSTSVSLSFFSSQFILFVFCSFFLIGAPFVLLYLSLWP